MSSEVSIASADHDPESSVEDLKRELGKARAHRAAASEILRIISLAPNDAQPVLDAIAKSATHLCEGNMSTVYCYDGRLIHLIAHNNWSAVELETVRKTYPDHQAARH